MRIRNIAQPNDSCGNGLCITEGSHAHGDGRARLDAGPLLMALALEGMALLTITMLDGWTWRSG